MESNSEINYEVPCPMLVKVNLIDHCSICLRRMVTDGEKFECEGEYDDINSEGYPTGVVVPKWSLPSELPQFRHLWPYLVGTGKKLEGVRKVEFVGGQGGVHGVTEVPPICNTCGDKFVELDRLHRELISKVKEIRRIIWETGTEGIPSGRREGFLELLRNSQLDPVTIESTFKFLEYLSSGVEKAEDVSPSTNQDEACHIKAPRIDDWKLNALAVVSLTQVVLPNGPEVDNLDCTLRRGRSRNVASEEMDYRDPNQDIKQEVLSDEDCEMKDAPEGLSDYFPSDCEDKVKCEIPTIKSLVTPKVKVKSGRGRPKRIRKKKYKRKSTSDGKLIGGWGLTFCDVCHAKISSSTMYEHMQNHIGDFTIKCPNPKCSYAFSNPRTMARIHVRRSEACRAAANKAGNICETCGLKVGSPITLRTHLVLHETATKNVACPFEGCGEQFTVRQSVHDHIYKKHLSAKTTQKCLLCQKYSDASDMESHLKDKHGIEEPIKCQQCPYIFPSWEALLNHTNKHLHHGATCYICNNGVKYLKNSQLRRHYYKQHQIGQQYVCEQCGREYTTADMLKTHIKTFHEGRKSFQKISHFKCELCDDNRTFRKEDSLVAHKIKEHGADPFTCKVCQKPFHNVVNLKSHEQQIHAVEQGFDVKIKRTQYPCDVDNCTEVYRSRGGLRVHKSGTHGIFGPRSSSHKCAICSKEFHQSGGLKKHYEGVHLGIRGDHMCDICGEHFITRHNLKRHKLIHTGERPLSCHICSQRFRQKEVLDVHLKSHQTLGDKFKPKGPMERRKRIKRD